MSVYFIERKDGVRFDDWVDGLDTWRLGIFRAFDKLEDADRIAERLQGLGYSLTVRHCPNPLTVIPGTVTLDAKSDKRARSFFTAAHPGIPIRLANPATVSMLATTVPVVIGNTMHYSGVFEYRDAHEARQTQGSLFDA